MIANNEDINRGYKVCDKCLVNAHIYNSGYDFDNWIKCDKCECWVVHASEVVVMEVQGK